MAAVMAPAFVAVVPPELTVWEPWCKTAGCRRRSDASSVAAHSGRAERSNGYADASIVDERIATG
jgi:hypothetical protein